MLSRLFMVKDIVTDKIRLHQVKFSNDDYSKTIIENKSEIKKNTLTWMNIR